jgi:predicted DNA-binding transcriptional regulator AlpA
MTTSIHNDLLTDDEAADLLRTTTATLANWRYLGRGPNFVRLGGRMVRYRRGDLEAWITDQTITPADAR